MMQMTIVNSIMYEWVKYYGVSTMLVDTLSLC